MPYNIGIDIEQVSRFKTKDIRVLKKIFSKNELKKIKNASPERIAGLFSAKESVIKACNPVKKLHISNIEIAHNKDGSPYAILKECQTLDSKDLKISISHSKGYVVAAAILSMKGS
jgi:phosphopantetheine--protein transferase-like protein